MKMFCCAMLTLCLIGTAAKPALADAVFGIDPDPITIVEGTPQVSFDLVISNTGDPGILTAFSYAVAVQRTSGTGSVSLTDTPVLLPENWTSVFAGSSPTSPAFYAADVFGDPSFPQSEIALDFPARVVRFTLDTSGTVAGDAYSIDPNFGGFSAAADGDQSYVVSSQLGTLNVTAVPEPSSVAVLGGLVAVGVYRWRRKQKAATAAVPC